MKQGTIGDMIEEEEGDEAEEREESGCHTEHNVTDEAQLTSAAETNGVAVSLHEVLAAD